MLISKIQKNGGEIKLEIGSGPVKGNNGWLTLDLSNQSDLYWNLLEPLPFPDNSISVIYSSHVLEHFYYRDLMTLLKECFRVLKPDGLFDVCVPNASIYIRAYLHPEYFDTAFLAYKPAVVSELKMDIVNYIAYMDGNHRFMFDQENLLRVLSSAGFVDICQRDFNPKLDKGERKHESIYALGVKP